MIGAFLCEDHVITKIVLAICVPAGCGAAVHKNRPSHGLAFNCAGEKVHTFSDGRKYVIKENDFIYLPKNTTYTVSAIAPRATFCINFQLLESAVSYIYKHYTEELIGVEKLSELCGFSYDYFSRFFKENVGVSPVEYKLNGITDNHY